MKDSKYYCPFGSCIYACGGENPHCFVEDLFPLGQTFTNDPKDPECPKFYRVERKQRRLMNPWWLWNVLLEQNGIVAWSFTDNAETMKLLVDRMASEPHRPFFATMVGCETKSWDVEIVFLSTKSLSEELKRVLQRAYIWAHTNS